MLDVITYHDSFTDSNYTKEGLEFFKLYYFDLYIRNEFGASPYYKVCFATGEGGEHLINGGH